MNLLSIDCNIGEVVFEVNGRNIIINDFKYEDNKKFESLGFEHYIDPLSQSCYVCELKFQDFIFFSKIYYVGGFLKIVNFVMVGGEVDDYNEWDCESGYNALQNIFDKTKFKDKIEDEFRSYVEYLYSWGVVAVYYSRVGLDVNFSIRWN